MSENPGESTDGVNQSEQHGAAKTAEEQAGPNRNRLIVYTAAGVGAVIVIGALVATSHSGHNGSGQSGQNVPGQTVHGGTPVHSKNLTSGTGTTTTTTKGRHATWHDCSTDIAYWSASGKTIRVHINVPGRVWYSLAGVDSHNRSLAQASGVIEPARQGTTVTMNTDASKLGHVSLGLSGRVSGMCMVTKQ